MMRHGDLKITAGIYTEAKVLMAKYRKPKAESAEQQEWLHGQLPISGQAGQTVAIASESD